MNKKQIKEQQKLFAKYIIKEVGIYYGLDTLESSNARKFADAKKMSIKLIKEYCGYLANGEIATELKYKAHGMVIYNLREFETLLFTDNTKKIDYNYLTATIEDSDHYATSYARRESEHQKTVKRIVSKLLKKDLTELTQIYTEL